MDLGSRSEWYRLYGTLFPKDFRWFKCLEEPEIIKFYNILSEEEINELRSTVREGDFQRSTTVVNNKLVIDDTRTNYTYTLTKNGCGEIYDNVVEKLLRRVCLLTQYRYHQIEAIQLTKYGEGEYFKEHMDTFEDPEPEEGQRIGSFLIWLNDMNEEDGGELEFTELGYKFVPDKGCGIFWWNTFQRESEEDKSPIIEENKSQIDDEIDEYRITDLHFGKIIIDERLKHKAHVVKKGTKEVLTIWIREKGWQQ
jgi:hypothetical protein